MEEEPANYNDIYVQPTITFEEQYRNNYEYSMLVSTQERNVILRQGIDEIDRGVYVMKNIDQ